MRSQWWRERTGRGSFVLDDHYAQFTRANARRIGIGGRCARRYYIARRLRVEFSPWVALLAFTSLSSELQYVQHNRERPHLLRRWMMHQRTKMPPEKITSLGGILEGVRTARPTSSSSSRHHGLPPCRYCLHMCSSLSMYRRFNPYFSLEFFRCVREKLYVHVCFPNEIMQDQKCLSWVGQFFTILHD